MAAHGVSLQTYPSPHVLSGLSSSVHLTLSSEDTSGSNALLPGVLEITVQGLAWPSGSGFALLEICMSVGCEANLPLGYMGGLLQCPGKSCCPFVGAELRPPCGANENTLDDLQGLTFL